MTPAAKPLQGLQFLAKVVDREARHLATTDERLFGGGFELEQAKTLDANPDLAERVEAFVGRFGRLQDTLADKLLPALLGALGERVSSAIDNLDRAERLGLIDSADAWVTMRKLRNHQMVHEYVEDPAVLFSALQTGHRFVPTLLGASDRMRAEIADRGWA